MLALSKSEVIMQGPPMVAAVAPSLRLYVQSGPNADTRIECHRLVTLLGSRSGCKVHLRHALVAPVHMGIVQTGGEIIAVDLLTKTGSKLNDLKLEHETLADGDELTVAPWAFRAEIEKREHGGNGDVHTLDLEPSPQLIAFEHVQSGRILQPNRKVCVIGRRPGADIHIDDNRVSRAHALLFVHQGYSVVLDLLSRNRTMVNGEAIHYRQLRDNDVLKIGDSEFRVRLVGSSVGQKKSKDVRVVTPPDTHPPVLQPAIALEDDLVDIQSVESSQRWRIADSLEKAGGKR